MAEKERLNSTDFHRMEIKVTEKHRYSSGRPKKGEPRLPVETRYVFIINIVEIDKTLDSPGL